MSERESEKRERQGRERENFGKWTDQKKWTSKEGVLPSTASFRRSQLAARVAASVSATVQAVASQINPISSYRQRVAWPMGPSFVGRGRGFAPKRRARETFFCAFFPLDERTRLAFCTTSFLLHLQ